RVISDDGSTAFFTSPDALVPQDTNGAGGCPMTLNLGASIPQCQDVYEWKDGTVSLISTGMDKDPALWVGASGNGNDAFFFTHSRLVGWDTDNYSDLYDARVNGGFPEPPPSAVCQGDECQGSAGAPPSTPNSGSSSF